MTPKEKAEKLVDKFYYDEIYNINSELGNISWRESKRCASIAVDEIIELDVVWYDVQLTKDYPKLYKNHQTIEFWQEVKKEIEKL